MLDLILVLAMGLSITTGSLQQENSPWADVARRVEPDPSLPPPTPADCDREQAAAIVGNAEALFRAAHFCAAAQKQDESIFLILAGQARAMADMSLLDPSKEPPSEAVGLYGYIYGTAGGAGPSEFYRDRARTDALFQRLRAWKAERPETYSPGWVGASRGSDVAYKATLSDVVEGRIDQLSILATLFRDEDYWRLQQELEVLMVSNNNTFEVGTPAELRMKEIQAEQDKVRERLGVSL